MSTTQMLDHRETPSGYRRRAVADLEWFLSVQLTPASSVEPYGSGPSWPRRTTTSDGAARHVPASGAVYSVAQPPAGSPEGAP